LLGRKVTITHLSEIKEWAGFFTGFRQHFLSNKKLLQHVQPLLYHKWVMLCLNSSLKKRKVYPIFMIVKPTWWQFRVQFHLAFLKSCVLNK
jgi:hypothetical protein